MNVALIESDGAEEFRNRHISVWFVLPAIRNSWFSKHSRSDVLEVADAGSVAAILFPPLRGRQGVCQYVCGFTWTGVAASFTTLGIRAEQSAWMRHEIPITGQGNVA